MNPYIREAIKAEFQCQWCEKILENREKIDPKTFDFENDLITLKDFCIQANQECFKKFSCNRHRINWDHKEGICLQCNEEGIYRWLFPELGGGFCTGQCFEKFSKTGPKLPKWKITKAKQSSGCERCQASLQISYMNRYGRFCSIWCMTEQQQFINE